MRVHRVRPPLPRPGMLAAVLVALLIGTLAGGVVPQDATASGPTAGTARAAAAAASTSAARVPGTPTARTPVARTGFSNPVVPQSASGADSPDPWMFRHDGRYWLAYTTGDHIEVRSSRTLGGLGDAEPRHLWPPAGTTEPAERCCEVWAPEIHRLTGPDGPRWYVYYAAKAADEGFVHRLYVLESESESPAGPYHFAGRLDVPQPFAIDATVTMVDGAPYVIYSGGPSASPTSLYLAPLADPWTVAATPIAISAPTLPWEMVLLPINEGPEVLQHDGQLHVIYSASWCGTGAYALGRLTVPLDADLTDPLTWADAKSPAPVFSAAPRRGVYGPGHGSFFTSPDGTEDWMVYHATDNSQGCFTGGIRTTRVQRFTWNADGTPDFGRPAALRTVLRSPGGDPTLTVQAEDAVAPDRVVTDRHLFGYEGVVVRRSARGPSAAFELDLARTGRYRIDLRVLGGPDAGRVTIIGPRGQRITRSATRTTDGAVVLSFGQLRLRAGERTLGIRVRDPLTIDQLRLR